MHLFLLHPDVSTCKVKELRKEHDSRGEVSTNIVIQKGQGGEETYQRNNLYPGCLPTGP